MKITDKDREYISGKCFDGGYYLKLHNNPLYSRIEGIKSIVKDKKVVHIGCCDHISIVEEKIKDGTWLHQILENECTKVLGIDIDEEAVGYINEKRLSSDQVICLNVEQDDVSEYVVEEYDYVLLGEILEHIDNPVDFMSKLKNNFSKAGFNGKYIITVPNAFSLQKGIYMRGVERINTDHRYWFTPYTISKVMFNAGLLVDEIMFVDYVTGANSSIIVNKILKLFRILARCKPSSYRSYRGSQMLVVCR